MCQPTNSINDSDFIAQPRERQIQLDQQTWEKFGFMEVSQNQCLRNVQHLKLSLTTVYSQVEKH